MRSPPSYSTLRQVRGSFSTSHVCSAHKLYMVNLNFLNIFHVYSYAGKLEPTFKKSGAARRQHPCWYIVASTLTCTLMSCIQLMRCPHPPDPPTLAPTHPPISITQISGTISRVRFQFSSGEQYAWTYLGGDWCLGAPLTGDRIWSLVFLSR